jgi:DNA-binding MarR family transcriptional regulator
MAKDLSFSQGYITKLMDRLEAAGLVERQASLADRRITYARLTEQGNARCSRLAPAFVEFMEEAGRALSQDEMQVLRSLLAKYRASAESVVQRQPAGGGAQPGGLPLRG